MLESMIQNLGNYGAQSGARRTSSQPGGVVGLLWEGQPHRWQGRKRRILTGSFMALSSPQASRGRSPSPSCPRSGPRRAKVGRPELHMAGTRALLRKRLVLRLQEGCLGYQGPLWVLVTSIKTLTLPHLPMYITVPGAGCLCTSPEGVSGTLGR